MGILSLDLVLLRNSKPCKDVTYSKQKIKLRAKPTFRYKLNSMLHKLRNKGYLFYINVRYKKGINQVYSKDEFLKKTVF